MFVGRGATHANTAERIKKLMAIRIKVIQNKVCARTYRGLWTDGMICGGLTSRSGNICNGKLLTML